MAINLYTYTAEEPMKDAIRKKWDPVTDPTDQEWVKLASFDTEEEARAALKERRCQLGKISAAVPYLEVTLYFISEFDVDDSETDAPMDIIDFAPWAEADIDPLTTNDDFPWIVDRY